MQQSIPLSFANKHIGIWGFGAVGKSALRFFSKQQAYCHILDQRQLIAEEKKLIKKYKATFAPQHKLKQFLTDNDYIIPSPGIDISAYKDTAAFISELDIFFQMWKKPIIAITGTVGKTTVTSLLSALLSKHMNLAVGGNIGTPMLDLFGHQGSVDAAVLECSSWQLEYTRCFAPDIAIWTNLYPNHLDRHKTMDAYFHAKARILQKQTSKQHTILPFTLRDTIKPLHPQAKLWWCTATYLTQDTLSSIKNHEHILFVADEQIMLYHHGTTRQLLHLHEIPKTIMLSNLLCLLAVCQLLHIPLHSIKKISPLSLEHRLEPVNMLRSGICINDSKSTTCASTLAAVRQFHDKPTILFLGGLSKGIDRSELIKQLPSNVKLIICFGKEADTLKQMCEKQDRPAQQFEALAPAVTYALKKASSTDVILFSPAGSSFDLYSNYQERGVHFKQLIASNDL